MNHRHMHHDEHGKISHAQSKIAKSMRGGTPMHHLRRHQAMHGIDPHTGMKSHKVTGPGRHQRKMKKVMHEFKHGELHSGSKHGPEVTKRKQAIAIGLSEARKARRKHK